MFESGPLWATGRALRRTRLVRAAAGPARDADSADIAREPNGLDRPAEFDGGQPRRRLRSSDPGWIGAVLVLAIALGLTTLRASAGADAGPGMSLLAILATFAAFAGPGLVGAIGAATGRRAALVGAGVACLPLSLLAFSGVTLVLLAPACLFLYAGLKVPDRSVPRPSRAWLAAALAGVLVVGGFAPFLATETVCWDRYADRGVIVRQPPDEPNGPSDTMIVGSGCDGGQTSLVGGSMALAALAVAAGLALGRGDGGRST